jgi:hypothetical protein
MADFSWNTLPLQKYAYFDTQHYFRLTAERQLLLIRMNSRFHLYLLKCNSTKIIMNKICTNPVLCFFKGRTQAERFRE